MADGGGVLFNIWPMGGGGGYCLIDGLWGGGVLFNRWGGVLFNRWPMGVLFNICVVKTYPSIDPIAAPLI